MPMVDGKKYAYTEKGKAAAKKAMKGKRSKAAGTASCSSKAIRSYK